MKKTIVLIFCCALIFVSGDDASNPKKPPSSKSKANLDIKVPTVPPTGKTISKINKEIKTSETTTNSNKDSSINSIPDVTISSATEKTAAAITTITTENPITTTPTTTPPPTTTTTTTASTTTSSTTEKPMTTTNEPITTTAITPAPPVPDPESRKWQVNGTNETIIVQMAVQLVIHYTDVNKNNLSKAINIQTDNRTLATGTFAPYNETLKLSWKSNGVSDNFVQFYFSRDNKTFELKSVEVLLDPTDLPNGAFNSSLRFLHTQAHFNTSLGNSYRCIRLQTFNLTRENDTKSTGQMKVSNLQFQAFKTDKKDVFGFAEDCAFETPDVVPIAVGCILAALVVIVLVAYLINRKNRPNGYHSM